MNDMKKDDDTASAKSPIGKAITEESKERAKKELEKQKDKKKKESPPEDSSS